jgi:hypothetical protein
MSLNSLSIRGKLATAFATLMIVLVTMGGIAIQQSLTLRDTTVLIANDSLPSVDVLGRLIEGIARLRRSQATDLLVLLGRATEQTNASNKLRRTELREQVETSWRSYEPLVDPGEERRLADIAREKVRAYLAAHDRFQEILRSNTPDAAFAYDDGDLAKAFVEVLAAVHASRDHNRQSWSASRRKPWRVRRYGWSAARPLLAL